MVGSNLEILERKGELLFVDDYECRKVLVMLANPSDLSGFNRISTSMFCLIVPETIDSSMTLVRTQFQYDSVKFDRVQRLRSFRGGLIEAFRKEFKDEIQEVKVLADACKTLLSLPFAHQDVISLNKPNEVDGIDHRWDSSVQHNVEYVRPGHWKGRHYDEVIKPVVAAMHLAYTGLMWARSVAQKKGGAE